MAMTQPAPSAVGRRSSVVRPYGDLVSQYLELRDQHPGVLLLFRVGAFYEVLFEDAELVAAELGRPDPADVLLPRGRRVPDGLLTGRNVTPLGPSGGADERLRRAFPEAELGDLPLARAAAGLAVGYLEATRAADVAALESPQQAAPERGLRLDAATQRHLELVETERSRERAGSLLATLDRTVSPMGRRMLRSWVLHPLTDLGKVGVRQRIVAELVAEAGLRAALRERLRETSDLERLAGRAAARQVTLDDLHALAAVAGQFPLLPPVTSARRPPVLRALARPRPGLA